MCIFAKTKKMFIEVHDRDTGLGMCLNTEDISRIEDRRDGCVVYAKTVADDYDKTKHQVAVAVQESFDSVVYRLSNGGLMI